MKETTISHIRSKNGVFHVPEVVLQSEKNPLKFIVILVVAFTIILWTMNIPRIYILRDNTIESKVLLITEDVVNKSEDALKEIVQRASDISDVNKGLAVAYVSDVENSVLNKTKQTATQIAKLKQVTLDDLEEEKSRFEDIIRDAVSQIAEVTVDDIGQLTKYIGLANATNVEKVIETGLFDTEFKVFDYFTDLDSMYSYYDGLVSQIFQRAVGNGTESISVYLNANRKEDLTGMIRVRLCYNMSSQNSKLSDIVDTCVKRIATISECRQLLDEVANSLRENYARCDDDSLNEARNVVQMEYEKSVKLLRSMLDEDNYFLGTLVRDRANSSRKKMESRVLHRIRKPLTQFYRATNATISNYTIVQPDHWHLVRTPIYDSLREMKLVVEKKCRLLNDTSKAEDFKQRASFSGLKLWMEDKNKNFTEVVNHAFERKKFVVTQAFRGTIEYIDKNLVPFHCTLSGSNYVPDECPFSLNFQNYTKVSLSDYMKKVGEEKNSDRYVDILPSFVWV